MRGLVLGLLALVCLVAAFVVGLYHDYRTAYDLTLGTVICLGVRDILANRAR